MAHSLGTLRLQGGEQGAACEREAVATRSLGAVSTATAQQSPDSEERLGQRLGRGADGLVGEWLRPLVAPAASVMVVPEVVRLVVVVPVVFRAVVARCRCVCHGNLQVTELYSLYMILNSLEEAIIPAGAAAGSSLGQQSAPPGQRGSLGTTARAELGHDVRDVDADCLGADVELAADLAVAPTFSDQGEDLHLARGQVL